MSRKFLTPVGLPSGASVPATGSAGALFFNTSDGFIYNHNGTSWSPIVGDGMPSGGTTGQLLSKIDGTDYNTEWVDETSIATSTVKHLVKNDSGVTLTKGTVVYTKSANGTNILVDKAIATDDIYSSQVLGFLESDLLANETGYCVNNGLVTNINTNGATAGDPVWLSGTTAGAFVTGTGNKPVAPNHLVYLGVITRANSNTGEIFVHISNGWELDELHNVLIDGTPADNEVLAYDSASSLWKNQTASEAGLAALSGASFTGNISTTGDANVAGKLSVTASAGDEGGEIFLAKPATNTSINTGVTIDINQNLLRFFETGGTNRGYYIDVTTGGASVGTSLTGGSTGAMNYAQTVGTKQSGISSAGTTIVSVSITTNGYPIQVTVTGDMENNSAGSWVVLQLYRGATAIGNPVHAESSAGSENVPYALSVIDAPAAGTYTYALKLNNAAGGTFNFGESNGPVITAIELSGPKGDTGSAGTGVPTGGTTGQVLAKINNDNYATEWTTVASTFNGGTITNALSVSNTINTTGQFTSTYAGAPFVVSNTTVVANLNADLLDGYQTSTSTVANTVVVRDANGSFSANVITTDGITLSNATAFVVQDTDSVVGRVIGSSNVLYIQAGANSADTTGHIYMGRTASASAAANITLNATTTNVVANLVIGGTTNTAGQINSTYAGAPLTVANATTVANLTSAYSIRGAIVGNTAPTVANTANMARVYVSNTAPVDSLVAGDIWISF